MSKPLHTQRLLAFLLGLLSFSSALGAEYESRIWTDKSGKHEIRATLVDVVDGVVRLERPNGDISRVKLDLLCKEDQDYIRDAGEEKNKPGGRKEPQRPAGPVGLQVGDRLEAEHFGKWMPAVVVAIDHEWGHAEVRIEGKGDFEWDKDMDELRYPDTLRHPVLVKPTPEDSGLNILRPDYSEMARQIVGGSAADRIAADPRPAAESSWKPRSVRFDANEHWVVHDADFAVVNGPRKLAMLITGEMGRRDQSMFTMVDMETRKTLLNGPAPKKTARLAVSPSGKYVVTLPGDFMLHDFDGVLHFWEIDGGKVEHSLGFSPYIQYSGSDAAPEWADWIDDRRLITINDEGQAFLWDVEHAKAEYELMLDRGGEPVLSPGRKYLAVPTGSGVRFFDARTGDVQAVVGGGNFRGGSLAFSPSGKQLAIASRGFIDVLDVTTGETTRSFPCEGMSGSSPIHWVDETYLYSEQGLFIHVPLRLVAWKFELSNVKLKSSGGVHWALVGNPRQDTMILSPIDLPPPEVAQAIKGIDAEEMLLVRPGDTICVDVQFRGDNLLAQEVEEVLKEGLTEAGMKVADEAPLKLVARKKNGDTEKAFYRSFGVFHGQGQEISVTTRIYELELLHEGVPIWQRKAVQSAPHHLQLEEGESTRDAIRRVMKPSVNNFKGRLPSYVLRPEYRKPLGSTQLSPTM